MATFLVAHGGWSAGWVWKKMRSRLEQRGHMLFVPTHTGLGERLHLATPEIGLGTHIADVLGVIEFEDLRDVILVGHSYGGMVATGVADRAADRVSQLVYLDAFVPRSGQSLFDLQTPELRARMRDKARESGDGWRVPPNPTPPDTSEADVAWIRPRRMMQPLRCFEEPLQLEGHAAHLPRSYIYCQRAAPGDGFRPFAEHARSDPDWRYYELDASHSPHVTAPDALAELLDRIAGG